MLKFLEVYTRISCGELGDMIDDVVSIDDLFGCCFRKKKMLASRERGCDDDEDDYIDPQYIKEMEDLVKKLKEKNNKEQ